MSSLPSAYTGPKSVAQFSKTLNTKDVNKKISVELHVQNIDQVSYNNYLSVFKRRQPTLQADRYHCGDAT